MKIYELIGRRKPQRGVRNHLETLNNKTLCSSHLHSLLFLTFKLNLNPTLSFPLPQSPSSQQPLRQCRPLVVPPSPVEAATAIVI